VLLRIEVRLWPRGRSARRRPSPAARRSGSERRRAMAISPARYCGSSDGRCKPSPAPKSGGTERYKSKIATPKSSKDHFAETRPLAVQWGAYLRSSGDSWARRSRVEVRMKNGTRGSTRAARCCEGGSSAPRVMRADPASFDASVSPATQAISGNRKIKNCDAKQSEDPPQRLDPRCAMRVLSLELCCLVSRQSRIKVSMEKKKRRKGGGKGGDRRARSAGTIPSTPRSHRAPRC